MRDIRPLLVTNPRVANLLPMCKDEGIAGSPFDLSATCLESALMARTSIELIAPVDEAWPQLQQLDTWEGVAGLEDLKGGTHDADGNLTGFSFAMDTAVGRVSGEASVTGTKPAMTITGEQKGLAITLAIVLRESEVGSVAMIDASSKATSFLAKPLELGLNALLDTALDNEAAKIASRVS